MHIDFVTVLSPSRTRETQLFKPSKAGHLHTHIAEAMKDKKESFLVFFLYTSVYKYLYTSRKDSQSFPYDVEAGR